MVRSGLSTRCLLFRAKKKKMRHAVASFSTSLFLLRNGLSRQRVFEHVDDGQKSFGFTENVIGEQRMDNAFDSAGFNQFAGRFLKIAQRFDGNPVLVQKLLKQRHGLRLRAHGIQVNGLEQKLVEIFAEFPRHIDQFALGWIEQMTDKFRMVRHDSQEKYVFIDNGVGQRVQSSGVQLFQSISEVEGFPADVIHQQGKEIRSREPALQNQSENLSFERPNVGCGGMNLRVKALDGLGIRPRIQRMRPVFDGFKRRIKMVGFTDQLRIFTPETES